MGRRGRRAVRPELPQEDRHPGAHRPQGAGDQRRRRRPTSSACTPRISGPQRCADSRTTARATCSRSHDDKAVAAGVGGDISCWRCGVAVAVLLDGCRRRRRRTDLVADLAGQGRRRRDVRAPARAAGDRRRQQRQPRRRHAGLRRQLSTMSRRHCGTRVSMSRRRSSSGSAWCRRVNRPLTVGRPRPIPSTRRRC